MNPLADDPSSISAGFIMSPADQRDPHSCATAVSNKVASPNRGDEGVLDKRNRIYRVSGSIG